MSAPGQDGRIARLSEALGGPCSEAACGRLAQEWAGEGEELSKACAKGLWKNWLQSPDPLGWERWIASASGTDPAAELRYRVKRRMEFMRDGSIAEVVLSAPDFGSALGLLGADLAAADLAALPEPRLGAREAEILMQHWIRHREKKGISAARAAGELPLMLGGLDLEGGAGPAAMRACAPLMDREGLDACLQALCGFDYPSGRIDGLETRIGLMKLVLDLGADAVRRADRISPLRRLALGAAEGCAWQARLTKEGLAKCPGQILEMMDLLAKGGAKSEDLRERLVPGEMFGKWALPGIERMLLDEQNAASKPQEGAPARRGPGL